MSDNPKGSISRFERVLTSMMINKTKVPKVTMDRKPEDLAYLAGYIDADGSLGLQRRKKTGWYTPVLTITASRRDILEELQEIAAVGGYVWSGQQKKDAKRDFSRLMYSAKRACQVCEMVLPYLRLKKVQAQLLVHIGHWRIKYRNGRGFNYQAYFIPRYEEMHRLNEGNKSPIIR